MTLQIESLPHKDWAPLKREGCVNVQVIPLLKRDHLALVMLRFGKDATTDEHPADHEIDVVCLEGAGFTRVDDEQSPIFAGDRIHWPPRKPHRLWTTDSEMITLMVEHTQRVPPDEPVWEGVDSTMIAAFKYDEEVQELDVLFHNTGHYRYFDVPLDVVEGLREASSKGSYMRAAVINLYSYHKIKR